MHGFQANYVPRWYQAEAVNALYSYFAHSTGNPVVAMPTGTGKSLVIGDFSRRALFDYPSTRIMMLTHVKELIAQNAKAIFRMWPTAPLGIYSAGLRQNDTHLPIIYGGTQSVINNVEAFGWRDLLLIDECHLLSPNADTVLQKIIDALRKVNPHIKVIGFSATPYRLGLGMITDNGIFTDICYDLCSMEMFNRLIAEGWLSPLIPKRTKTELDISNVGMSNGEFALGALQTAVDKHEITYAAVREIVEHGFNRRCWLLFASGVDHAEHIATMVQSFGVSAAAVHSRLTDAERDTRIEAFKDGRLRCIVNQNVLTTGFDHPPIDLIGMLRPTCSTALWVQMLGRGTRPSVETQKENCLVLDFAGNTPRLGPINDPVLPRKKGSKGGGDAPVRICDNCGTYNHARRLSCEVCGNEFPLESKIVKTAGTDELIRSEIPEVEHYTVDRVLYNRHARVNRESGEVLSAPMIKVSYICGLRMFNEYVCLEHDGFAAKKARDWWRQRHWGEPPEKTDDALQYLSELRVPRRIRVWINKKYPEVLGSEF